MIYLSKKTQRPMETLVISAIIFGVIVIITGTLAGCGSVVKTSYSTNNDETTGMVYYYLPQTLIKIHSTVKIEAIYKGTSLDVTQTRIIEQSFIVTTENIADTDHMLILNHSTNIMASDDIKFAVNAKGLLETVNVTAEDRTAQIITKLAEAPKQILSATSGRSGDKIEGQSSKLQEYSHDFIFSAKKLLETTNLSIPWKIIVKNEMGGNDFFDVDAIFTVVNASENINIKNPVQQTGDIPSNNQNSTTNVNKINIGNKPIDGVVTRPIATLPIKIKATESNLNEALPFYITIADNRKSIVIPFKRAAFVKKINNVTILDGIITTNQVTQPSSFEGFVSIPIDIAKAIISIPAQLISFKIDNTNKMKELEAAKLAYETSLVANQKYTLNKEQELETVKLELAKTSLKNSGELAKVKQELELAILIADKAKLTAEKEIISLKQEIEKLKPKQ